MIPKSNTPEAALLIETVMKEREYPCSPAAAARAGYEAARRAILSHKDKAEPTVDDELKARMLFKEKYLGNSELLARRNEAGDYVIPAIQDAWGGFLGCYMLQCK